MPTTETLLGAFGGREWRTAVDALFEAVGLVVTVMDCDAREVVFSTESCAYCQLAVPQQPGTGCLGPGTEISGTWRPTVCRGGLPCYVGEVPSGDHVGCLIVVGGFVSTTRERSDLFNSLVKAGVAEDVAHETLRDTPLLARRQVQALARMLVAEGTAALARATENSRWATRVRELELFVEAGTVFGEADDRRADVVETALERAMGIVGADCGTLLLLRPGTDILEAAASRGEVCREALGACVRLGEGVEGRVAQTGRGVLVASGEDELHCFSPKAGVRVRQAISVPISRDGRTMGVMSVGSTDEDRCFSAEELRLLDRFGTMAAVAIDNSRGRGASERAKFELMKLSAYAKSLGVTASVDDVANVTVSVLEKAFDFDLAGVVITGWSREQAVVVVGSEVPGNAIAAIVAEAAGLDDVPATVADIRLITYHAEPGPDIADIGDWSVLASEVLVHGAVVGHLFLASKAEGTFAADDKRLMDGLADHAGAALGRAALFARLRDDYARTIAALSATLDAGEFAPRGHADRVMDYAMAIGEEFGLEREDIEVLRFAGLLHDVGKMGLAEEILLKPSKLTDEEMEKVRTHVQVGADIVEQLEFLGAITPVILHHHERWDGTGYPFGLAGADIPLLARILAVADSFDVMTSERPYHRRLSYAEARRELEGGAGTQFDSDVVHALIDALDARVLAGATGLLVARSEEERLPS